MHRIKGTDHLRVRSAAIAAMVGAAAFASIGSCFFDTKTTLCEAYGLRCQPGQVCAANQEACINAGGCGDGVKNGIEICDDGNIKDGDGCSAICDSEETCGNGIADLEAGEPCDHTAPGTSNCSSDCKLEVCGNRILDPDEVCDDGNQVPSDGCSEDCKSNEACGNGIEDRNLGEECEFSDAPFPRRPSDTAACDNDCTLPECGDGHVNSSPGPNKEYCDPGIIEMDTPQDSATCDSNCTSVVCGDEHINTPAGEECDDGEELNDDDDRSNSNVQPNACRTNCRRAFCGDRVTDRLEECDEGRNTANCNGNNNSDGMGNCQEPDCGDGYYNPAANEDCDPEAPNSDAPCGQGKSCDSSCECVEN